MRHNLLSAGLIALVSVAVSWGQPPGPPPAPVVVAGGAAPIPSQAGGRKVADPPLARFDPLAAFPVTTQISVRAVLLGSNWLTRMNQAQGRFLPGYRPALRQPTEEGHDHDLKQARAALALAQAARFAGDDRQAVLAGQAILALLAVTRPDPADPAVLVPVRSSMTCNRVGFAAVLALAIYELPAADDKLVAQAERLCAFVRRHLRPDGSVRYTDGPDDGSTTIDPAGVNEYPGAALHALAAGNRARPAEWKVGAVAKGVAYYRAFFKTNPHPMLAATLIPVSADLYLQTKSADAAAAAFELTDWLIGLQYPTTDPRHPVWAGGFKGWAAGRPVETEPGYECGPYLQGLACAYHLTRLGADLTRADRYRQATLEAAQFLTGLQYVETNTRHFENNFRANTLIGGFYLSTTDGNLQVDATARAITGLLRFLSSGAEQ